MADTTAAPAATPAKAAPAVDPKAQATPTPAAEPTQEFVVNGKPVKLTAAQVKMAVQKGLFADQQLKSIDVLKKNTEALISKIKTPEGIIEILRDKSLGNSPQAVLDKLLESDMIDDGTKERLSKWVYERVVKPSKMSPEEIEREKKLSEYERMKAEADKRKQTEEQQQQQAKVQQIYQGIRAEVTKQIVADKTFPQTEGCIRQVIDKLRVMNKSKAPITSQTIAKAIENVKKDHLLFQQSILDGDKDQPDYGERLISRIGEERALAISRALVARLQAKQKASVKEEKKADGSVSLEEGLAKKYGTTKDGRTIMNW